MNDQHLTSISLQSPQGKSETTSLERVPSRRSANSRPALVAQVRPKNLPVSYSQQRLWFIDRLEGGSTEYNMAVAMRLSGKLDLGAVEKAINTIMIRHESLQTHFSELDGEP